MLTGAQLQTWFDDAINPKWNSIDLIVNNTTSLTTATGLTLAMLANASYVFDGMALYDTNTTADFQFAVTTPTGSGYLVPLSAGTTATTTTNSLFNGATALNSGSTTAFACGGVGAGTIMSANFRGYYTCTIAGNFTIGFSQNTAAVVNTILKTGSFVRYSRVA